MRDSGHNKRGRPGLLEEEGGEKKEKKEEEEEIEKSEIDTLRYF